MSNAVTLPVGEVLQRADGSRVQLLEPVRAVVVRAAPRPPESSDEPHD
jgi:hypothetical protein